jgi:hypothetical protein
MNRRTYARGFVVGFATLLSGIATADAQTMPLKIRVNGGNQNTTYATFDRTKCNPPLNQNDDVMGGETATHSVDVKVFIYNSKYYLEFTNPITQIANSRLVFRDIDGFGAGEDLGSLVVDVNVGSSPPWNVTVKGADFTELTSLECCQDVACPFGGTSVVLCGTTNNPPCCPLEGGSYDCSCTPLGLVRCPPPRCGQFRGSCSIGCGHSPCYVDPCADRRRCGLFRIFRRCR